MPNLVGLENTRKIRKAYMVRSASAAIAGLRKGRAMCSADDFGAINAWRGYDKRYRVEAMRHCQTVDKQTLSCLTHVRTWYAKWLKKIGENSHV